MINKVNRAVQSVTQWVNGLRPVRVFAHFGRSGGALLTGGMSYQSIFAVFAALWVAFSVAGLWLTANPALQHALYDTINQSIPNLIGADGIVNPAELTNSTALSWSAAIALLGLLSTALGWMSITAQAIRTIFRMPPNTTFFLLLKARELGLGLLFGFVLLASAALSVASTEALQLLFPLVGLPVDSFWFDATVRVVGLTIVLVIDTVTLAVLFRVLSQIHIPFRRLLVGSVLGAIGLGVLKVLGSVLLRGAGANPLLAAFAVIIGLLIWFKLTSTAILLAASWIAVGMADAGLTAHKQSESEQAEHDAQRENDALRIAAEVELRNALQARADAPWYSVWSADRRLRAARKYAHRHGVAGPN
ncbi:membrane protein [Leifsonia psychrotolerans]|uniref:Membrane protein n=1 Tax=Glaciibacter psychrotolerans TaxID=670054 RepID=A0A7Z0EF16_9MICO|nr:YihY/virulence factor BrkB family protein [Leifsonia psychrotolerans]NYJ20308.1 membrane protein [Leifsonia psychrotolerans]